LGERRTDLHKACFLTNLFEAADAAQLRTKNFARGVNHVAQCIRTRKGQTAKKSRTSVTLGSRDLQAVIARTGTAVDNSDFLMIGIETRFGHRAGTRLSHANVFDSPPLSRINIQPFVKPCALVPGVGHLEEKIPANLTRKAKTEILRQRLAEVRR